MKGKLTPQQSQFVIEYIVDLNGTQAEIRSGYSENGAKETASRLITINNIAQAIQKQLDARAERTLVTADRVINELAKIAFIDVKDIFDENGNLIPVSELDNGVSAAISSIEVLKQKTEDGEDPEWIHKIKLWDKKSALETLAKHLHLVTDKKEIDINLTANIIVEEVDLEERANLLLNSRKLSVN